MSFISETTWLNGLDHGWGNGYVAVPPGHKLHGVHYSDKVKVKDLDNMPHNGNFIALFIESCDHKDGEVSLDLAINVHCGITFSQKASLCKAGWIPKRIPGDYWIFGFDTCHYDDTINNWPKERVQKETRKLKRMIENIDKILI